MQTLSWLARFPVGLFAVPVGLFALGGAWRRATAFGWSGVLMAGDLLAAAALTLLLLLLLIYGLKALRLQLQGRLIPSMPPQVARP